MDSPAFILYFFLLIFVIVFLANLIFGYRKIKKKKFDSIGEMNYLISKFKLDKKKINYRHEIICISFINSLIISSVSTFVAFLDIMIILQLALGFILLFALIYSLYEIYGRHLLKKTRRD